MTCTCEVLLPQMQDERDAALAEVERLKADLDFAKQYSTTQDVLDRADERDAALARAEEAEAKNLEFVRWRINAAEDIKHWQGEAEKAQALLATVCTEADPCAYHGERLAEAEAEALAQGAASLLVERDILTAKLARLRDGLTRLTRHGPDVPAYAKWVQQGLLTLLADLGSEPAAPEPDDIPERQKTIDAINAEQARALLAETEETS